LDVTCLFGSNSYAIPVTTISSNIRRHAAQDSVLQRHTIALFRRSFGARKQSA